MDNPSYFSPRMAGGAYGSLGYQYQDLCALFFLFDGLNRDIPIKSIGIEMINDFSLHLEDSIVSAQVKKKVLGLADIKYQFRHSFKAPHHKLAIVATHFQEDAEQLIRKREFYRNTIHSDLSSDLKERFASEFKTELSKCNMKEWEDIFLSSEFRVISEHNAESMVFFSLWTWCDRNKKQINIPECLNHLKVLMQQLRGQRNQISLDELIGVVDSYAIKNEITKPSNYTSADPESFEPSSILSILGETKEDLLEPIKKQLLLAHEHIQAEHFQDALDIYSALATLYHKDNIFLRCAVLHERMHEYSNAIGYCDRILLNAPLHYEARMVKGECLGELEEYANAIVEFEWALACKETPEANYNLGYSHMMNNSYSEAMTYYKKCLELDDCFSSAHLNLSICYFHNLLLEESLTHVNRAIELEPEKYQAYGRKGELYRFLHLYDDAIDYFKQCLSRDETNYQALIGCALSYAEQGKMLESQIHFSLFFNTYKDKFFPEEKPVDTKVGMIDIGWEQTKYILIEYANFNSLDVHIAGAVLSIPLHKSESFIFIGAAELRSTSGSMLYPHLGKSYSDPQEFYRVAGAIKQCCGLFQWFDEPKYVDFNNCIKVKISEMDSYILIEMNFNNSYSIIGMTNGKSGGLEAFFDYYERYGQFRIQLECATDMFIIDCLKEAEITWLER